jgi:uncharacterized repeat protein (TIGR01451 family)
MKFVAKPTSLVTRLATLAAVLLFSQQATAVGTQAGTVISNQATVDYSVGLVPQSSIQSAASTFMVDNRVDFTIVANPNTPVVPTVVTVGDVDVVVQFIIENTGNQTQDYSFLPANEADLVDVDGFIDSGDMNNLRVMADNNDNGIADDAEAYIDELGPDTTRFVWILADADTPVPNELLDGDVANMLMTATTRDGGGLNAQGNVTVSSAGPDDPNAEDTVLAVGSVLGEGSGSSQNTYQLQSAALTITKSETLIDDPINGNVNPFHIPGATVEYTIDVENTSATTAATAVRVNDTLTNVALVDGDTINIDNGGALSTCTADLGDADLDGCGLTQNTPTEQLLEVGNANADYSIAATETLTITFQPTIL